ncbi:SDR family NAD(P)-dependent oxidoreductase [Mesorhizobium sp. DCY119]|uniref:SDR family NAD(P)-dependent oxidoreductase n=1 Tax=Mesorhizobium sp. DCY119 TaxID=2108445 RepID=UPI000E711F6B|nr:SDR family NAD(P)-dependent oxidoreductase [Mesorhizobium sp. DCY119]RJG40485.1 SDR family oxidoreductase [Mesorhizobium sp. DCY119]
MSEQQLLGRSAVVTGGASGIGRAIALAMARAGAHVVVADVAQYPKEGGQTTLELIGQDGGEGQFICTDVTSWMDICAAVAAAVRVTGRLDVMVNNAATFSSTALHETTAQEWNRVVAVNLTGYFNGCKSALVQMLPQEPVNEVRGRIININSMHGMIRAPNDFTYGVTKAGGIYMTKQIAAEYAKDLIVCNGIAPGKIVTGKSGAAADPSGLEYARARTPMPRLGRPQDIANAAVFLASDLCSYMTGVNLLVDGGWMAD